MTLGWPRWHLTSPHTSLHLVAPSCYRAPSFPSLVPSFPYLAPSREVAHAPKPGFAGFLVASATGVQRSGTRQDSRSAHAEEHAAAPPALLRNAGQQHSSADNSVPIQLQATNHTVARPVSAYSFPLTRRACARRLSRPDASSLLALGKSSLIFFIKVPP